MNARARRRKILLSTATLIGALSGYGRSAYADCTGPASNIVCSGAETTPQSVINNDATVSTVAGFSVITSGTGSALSIAGDGALSYTDENGSTLTATGIGGLSPISGLHITSEAQNTPAGSITVNTNGALEGTEYGLYTRNEGSGAINITTSGDVTGIANSGIIANNNLGTNISITTGAGRTVSGTIGIEANNFTSGFLSITANGQVVGTQYAGIEANNDAGTTNLTVTTGAASDVSGTIGIDATNSGTGTLSVEANGAVTGNAVSGINAVNSNGGDLNVTVGTGAAAMIDGAIQGIYGHNENGTNDLAVTTGVGSTVHGDQIGIDARNEGSGNLTVTTNGDVDGGSDQGINARNEAAGDDLLITTGTDSTVTGGQQGIAATNSGLGVLQIEANGTVTGTLDHAISAHNINGTDLTITTGANSDVTGRNRGIDANNDGSAALTITANGTVEGDFQDGINAQNAGTNLTITTGANSDVQGGQSGIAAVNNGSAVLSITANGYVRGALNRGIDATNNGSALNVTTGANSEVIGFGDAIFARNNGGGTLNVTAKGEVTGALGSGIHASGAGSATSVTTAVGSTVEGDEYGIIANTSNGTVSITANGDVIGTNNDGIFAENTSSGASDIKIVTGAGTTVNGGYRGIGARSYSTGKIDITTNGDVTGTIGIRAHHYGGGAIDITVGANSTVTSNSFRGGAGVRTYEGATSLTVAGTVDGGIANAIEFDQSLALDDRLELHPTAIVKGDVLAGLGTDTLAFGGSGDGSFDLADIDTGANTQQYQDFEIFQVDNGTWNLTGATTQDFAVNGGTLKGTGTFGGLTVNNGGTIAPGNSIGTLIVNGAFTLSAGAIYEAEVNAAGGTDQIIVKGTVNLTGATLNVLAANGAYKTKTKYTIIDNDGVDAVTGTFATITSSLAFLVPTVIYNGGTGNDVVLTLERNQTQLTDVADTPNQKAVAGALDQHTTNEGLFLAVVGLTAEGARQAFDALSGEIHATLAGVLADDSRYVREAILGRLMQAGHTDNSLGATGPQVASLDQNAMALGYDNVAAPSSQLAFWTSAYGAWGDYDGNRNAATADRDLGGFISGMDASIGGSWRVGLATGASYSSIDVDKRNSSADVESYHLAGYAGGMAGAFALRGGGAWAWNDIDTSRAVVFTDFFEREKASYDADTSQIFGEVAYPTEMGGTSIEPFAGLAYVSVDTDKFSERGGALASLDGRNTDQDVGYSTLGLRAATTTQWGSTMVTPHISAAWQHAFDDVTPGAALAFASTGVGFNITGVPLATNSALIDAGLDFALGEKLSAGLSYSGQFADGVQDNAVKGRFTWLF